MHTYIQTNKHTYTHTYKHACMHTYIRIISGIHDSAVIYLYIRHHYMTVSWSHIIVELILTLIKAVGYLKIINHAFFMVHINLSSVIIFKLTTHYCKQINNDLHKVLYNWHYYFWDTNIDMRFVNDDVQRRHRGLSETVYRKWQNINQCTEFNVGVKSL